MGTRETWWCLLGYVGVIRMCVGQGCTRCMWESRDVGVGGGSGEVATKVCIMLWTQLFDCWNSMAMVLMML